MNMVSGKKGVEDRLGRLAERFEGNGRGASMLQRRVHFEDAGAVGHWPGLTLRSVFQPLLDVAALLPAAHEALLRVEDAEGRAVSPENAFRIPETAEDIVRFDRLCRTIHALNFAVQAEEGAVLYLNVDGRHLLSVDGGTHGTFFETLLGFCELSPARVVLEILESRISDAGRLAEAIAAYQKRGFGIAIDDFGCRHSNFDRLWRLSPDIVKLDRGLILQADSNPRARKILPKLVEIIHDLGARVVCEGIETADQHALAVDAGADMVQGYFYARPAAALRPPPKSAAN